MKNTPKIYDYDYWLFLIWLLLISVIVFSLIVCWNEGYIQAISNTDKSHVSVLIFILFCIGTIHCALRSLYLSDQLTKLPLIKDLPTKCSISIDSDNTLNLNNQVVDSSSLVAGYFKNIIYQSNEPSQTKNTESTNIDLLIAKAKGNHDIGWHTVDILLKLGLIGTIVGFILMLSSVAHTENLDVDSMQTVLKNMSSGMGTALFTTLAGMTASILLGLQYLLIDKGADLLIENTIEITDKLDVQQ